jgi:membrane protease subunit HflK
MASRLNEEASGYKTEVVQRAEGDASRFRDILTEYQKAPGVTRDRLYLDMMQSVLGNSSKVLIDQKCGSNLLNLPLDRLLQQGAAAAAAGSTSDSTAAAPRAPTAPEPTATVDPGRSRDALRNREGR